MSIQDSFDLFVCDLRLFALEVEAFEFLNISFLNQTLELFEGTFGAESVLAVKFYSAFVAFLNWLPLSSDLVGIANRAVCHLFFLQIFVLLRLVFFDLLLYFFPRLSHLSL